MTSEYNNECIWFNEVQNESDAFKRLTLKQPRMQMNSQFFLTDDGQGFLIVSGTVATLMAPSTSSTSFSPISVEIMQLSEDDEKCCTHHVLVDLGRENILDKLTTHQIVS